MWKELLPQASDYAFSHWHSFMASCANCQDFLNSAFVRNVPAESQIDTTWHTCSKHLSMWLCSGLLKSKMFFKTSSRHGARCLPSPPLQLRLAQFAQGFFG